VVDGSPINKKPSTAEALRPIRRDEIGDNNPGPNLIFKQ
jgi:hypothetical protein